MNLEELYKVISPVIPNKVFYGTNTYDDTDNASMPYIVYQEISKTAIGYSDNKPIAFRSNIQITLVTKNKDLSYERLLEKTLLDQGINYHLTSEFANSDKSINRVYEITMEKF